MNRPAAFDTGIPVLTEVLDEAVAQPPAATEPAAPVEWAALEQRLAERIVAQLSAQLDAMIEQRVRASMRTVLDSASALVGSEVRRGMHDALVQAVNRAVADEVARASTQHGSPLPRG